MTGPAAARVARLSYFFPAHDEEANIEGLVAEALDSLPGIAETFEVIAVNDGSRDRTQALAASSMIRRHKGGTSARTMLPA